MTPPVNNPNSNPVVNQAPQYRVSQSMVVTLANGQRVKIEIDSTQQLSLAQIDQIKQKMIALGEMYQLGEKTKKLDYVEKQGYIDFTRQKVPTATKNPIMNWHGTEQAFKNEVIKKRAEQFKVKYQHILSEVAQHPNQRPEQIFQGHPEKLAAYYKAVKKIEAAEKADRFFSQTIPPAPNQPIPPVQPAAAPPPAAPAAGAAPGAQPNQKGASAYTPGALTQEIAQMTQKAMDLTLKENEEGKPGFAAGEIGLQGYKFQYYLAYKNKMDPTDMEMKNLEMLDYLSPYAKALELFPEMQRPINAMPVRDLQKFVLKEMDAQAERLKALPDTEEVQKKRLQLQELRELAAANYTSPTLGERFTRLFQETPKLSIMLSPLRVIQPASSKMRELKDQYNDLLARSDTFKQFFEAKLRQNGLPPEKEKEWRVFISHLNKLSGNTRRLLNELNQVEADKEIIEKHTSETAAEFFHALSQVSLFAAYLKSDAALHPGLYGFDQLSSQEAIDVFYQNLAKLPLMFDVDTYSSQTPLIGQVNAAVKKEVEQCDSSIHFMKALVWYNGGQNPIDLANLIEKDLTRPELTQPQLKLDLPPNFHWPTYDQLKVHLKQSYDTLYEFILESRLYQLENSLKEPLYENAADNLSYNKAILVLVATHLKYPRPISRNFMNQWGAIEPNLNQYVQKEMNTIADGRKRIRENKEILIRNQRAIELHEANSTATLPQIQDWKNRLREDERAIAELERKLEERAIAWKGFNDQLNLIKGLIEGRNSVGDQVHVVMSAEDDQVLDDVDFDDDDDDQFVPPPPEDDDDEIPPPPPPS